MLSELLPFDAPLSAFEARSKRLAGAYRAGDSSALRAFGAFHPALRRPDVKWLPRELSEAEVRDAAFGTEDARLVVARSYEFEDWGALVELVNAVQEGGAVLRFEAAVEAVVDGDLEGLRRRLDEDPGLVTARSTRRCCFDPPVHRATLLHYLAANGVEAWRQRSPKNAAELARLLCERGAEADAPADIYGGECTTLSLLVSSAHPAEAGVQVDLLDVLIDHGASLEGEPNSQTSPLRAALAFGYLDAARALVRRGARIESASVAAGLGRVEELESLLAAADAGDRHLALALAAQGGHLEALRLLIEAGEAVDRFNPPGAHPHSTPLHQAALGGHLNVVRLLVESGARRDLEDKIYGGTPLGWAEHGGKAEVVAYLASLEGS